MNKKTRSLIFSGFILINSLPFFVTSCSKDYHSETFLMTRFSINDFIYKHQTISHYTGIIDDYPEDINEFLCSNEVKIQNLVNGMVRGFFFAELINDDSNCEIRVDISNNEK
jgi:hypothetical protein